MGVYVDVEQTELVNCYYGKRFYSTTGSTILTWSISYAALKQ